MADARLMLYQLHHHADPDVTVHVVESLMNGKLCLVSRSRNGYIIGWQVEEPDGNILHFKEQKAAENYIRRRYHIAPHAHRWDGDF